MLRLLTRCWGLAVLLAAVLAVTLVQSVPPAVATGGTDPLDLPPLAAPAPAVQEPEQPAGDLLPAPLPAEETATPVEFDIPEVVGDGVIDVGSLEVTGRSEFSTEYAAPDGAAVEQLSIGPLNAEVDGEWVEIDTDIESSGSGWAVEAHPLAPEFAEQADSSSAVTLSRYGHELSFTLVGAGEGAVQAPFWWWDEWDTIGYDEVMPGVDIEYEVTSDSVKESVILQDVPAAGDKTLGHGRFALAR